VVQANTALMVDPMFSGNRTAQSTKRTVTEAETQKTVGSKGFELLVELDIELSF
jgi:hypothetical protein